MVVIVLRWLIKLFGDLLIQSNPIQCDMTGAGGASLPASQMTIYYIQTGRPPVPVKSQS